MTLLIDIVPQGISWGLNIELKSYTDEKVASNDFKAGMCDVAFLTDKPAQYRQPVSGYGATLPNERSDRAQFFTIDQNRVA